MINLTKLSLQSILTLMILSSSANAAAVSSPQKSAANAKSAAVPTRSNTKTNSQSAIDKKTTEKRQTVIGDATIALRETENAMTALENGNKAEALQALERSMGKLDLVLARDPKLALAPTGVSVTTHEVIANADEVKRIRKEVSDLVDDGRIQDARRLLEGLASETVISVPNIPLATYPAAIKEAARLIDQGKTEEAKGVLQVAMSTLVVTETIIPLPVASADQLLKDASRLSEKKDRTTAENQELARDLQDAKKELEFAQLLGYGTRSDFDHLYAQLRDVEKKTGNGKWGSGFFNDIKNSMAKLFKSSQPGQSSSQQAAAQHGNPGTVSGTTQSLDSSRESSSRKPHASSQQTDGGTVR